MTPIVLGTEIFRTYEQLLKEHPDLNEWCAEAVRAEFPSLVDQIMVARICRSSRNPWEDNLTFEKIALVLNGRSVISDIIQDLYIREISFAVKVLKAEFPNEDFNDSVSGFIAAEALDEGFVILPKVLTFAQHLVPLQSLTVEQREVQKLYLQEVDDYISIMGGID